MATETTGRGFWRDDEIVVDKDGIPHYTGVQPGLMREYRKRVLFAYSSLEGSGDDEEKEKKSLAKKQSRFAKKLIDGLHGEAWRACQELVANPEELRVPDGYKKVFAALQQIEKVSVIKATEAFDTYFEKCYRKRGQAIDSFLRQRRQDWADLQDLAENVNMSPELQAYFLLKNVNLPKEDRRQILLACQSSYSVEAIEKALRVSYYDYHEKEKAPPRDWPGNRRPNKGYTGKGPRRPHYAHAVLDDGEDAPEDEDEDGEALDFEDEAFVAGDEGQPDAEGEPSDLGASEDDVVYEAFASYQDSRRKLKEVQKSRGFFRPKGEDANEERRQALAKEKARTRCAACGRLGHWAGDNACTKGNKGSQSPRRKGSSPKKGGRANGKGKAFLVSEAPLYFSLNDGEGDGYCDMVLASSEDGEMDQDDGATELDGKRKLEKPQPRPDVTAAASSSGWELVSEVPPFPFEGGDASLRPELFERAAVCEDRVLEQQVVIPVKAKDIEVHEIVSFAKTMPVGLEKMIVRDLQADCDRWGVQTSGTRAEVLARLRQLYRGELVLKKGCTKRWVQLREYAGSLLPMAAQGYEPKDSKATTSAGPCRIFRTSAIAASTENAAASSRDTSSAPRMPTIICPRSGLAVPPELVVGEIVPQIGCVVCKCPLGLRQRLDKTGYFFGCYNFAKAKRCKFTLDLPEGLQLYEKARRGGRS
eukprot:s748_g7.t1